MSGKCAKHGTGCCLDWRDGVCPIVGRIAEAEERILALERAVKAMAPAVQMASGLLPIGADAAMHNVFGTPAPFEPRDREDQ